MLQEMNGNGERHTAKSVSEFNIIVSSLVDVLSEPVESKRNILAKYSIHHDIITIACCKVDTYKRINYVLGYKWKASEGKDLRKDVRTEHG